MGAYRAFTNCAEKAAHLTWPLRSPAACVPGVVLVSGGTSCRRCQVIQSLVTADPKEHRMGDIKKSLSEVDGQTHGE